jgi:creatinine amidohydrolase
VTGDTERGAHARDTTQHVERGSVLAHATLPEVERGYRVAVLPWGATEAHNRHLPYGTDTIEATAVAAAAAASASARGARVVVLPAVPYGVQTGQLDIPLCINLNPSTQLAVLGDIVDSLEPHGVRFLVVLNGHGGNEFKALIRELQPNTSIFLCSVNWWQAVAAADFFDEPGDHAGELETSTMLHIAPQLVAPLSQAGPGAARGFRIDALRQGWAWAPRQWTKVTDDTGVGDPRAATAARGAAFFDAAVERIGAFLAELAAADPDDMYETAE